MPGQKIVEYPLTMKDGKGSITLSSGDVKLLHGRRAYLKKGKPHISLNGKQVSVISIVGKSKGIRGSVTVRDGNYLRLTRDNVIPYDPTMQRRSSSAWSGFKGVYWREDRKRWMASIQVDGKQRYIGLFTTAIEAAVYYDIAAIENFGPSAVTNIGIGRRKPILEIAEEIINRDR